MLYKYGAYNLNKAQYQNNEKVYDGNFMIAKSILDKDKVVLKRKNY